MSDTNVLSMLLPVRQRIFTFIGEYVAAHGYPPSVREVAAEIGLSSSTTQYHLKWLRESAWVIRDDSRPRAIRLRDPADGSDGEAAA